MTIEFDPKNYEGWTIDRVTERIENLEEQNVLSKFDEQELRWLEGIELEYNRAKSVFGVIINDENKL